MRKYLCTLLLAINLATLSRVDIDNEPHGVKNSSKP
jgi:hypothetical protein